MLTELHLDNWKSFASATLHIDPLTVLIGANAGGKSNVLDALLFLSRSASGFPLTPALQGNTLMQPLRGGTEWAARRPGNRFAVGVTVRGDAATDYRYRLECEVSKTHCTLYAESLYRFCYEVDAHGQRLHLLETAALFQTEPCTPDDPNISVRIGKEETPPYSMGRGTTILLQLLWAKPPLPVSAGLSLVTDALRNIFILDPIPAHMRGYSAFSEKIAADAGNIAGVIAALPDDKRQEIEATLTRYTSRLPERDIRRIYTEPVGRFKTDAMLYCEEQWCGAAEDASTTVDARSMSDGTLRFLAVLTALLTRPEGSLLVIEEVDSGLHPARAQLLLEMLLTVGAQRAVDILVTTHNSALLDAMGGEMLPFITVAHRDGQTGAGVLTLLEDIQQLPKLMAQGSVGRLSTQGAIERVLSIESAKAPICRAAC